MQPHAQTANENPEELRDPARLSPHPRRTIVPAMSEAEYRSLHASIERHGLRSPLEIDAADVVLDGHQRLRAARELGLKLVPVRLVAPADPVEHMVTAAVERRQLTASQLGALAVELEQYWREREHGLKRRRANVGPGPDVATLPHRGRARDAAAARFGVGARTIQDAATVKAADPLLFEQVKQGTLPAHKAARQVRRACLYAEIGEEPPLPAGQFELIYADPPWQLGSPDSENAPENHYPTMALAKIEALQLPAAASGVLFLWAVNCLLPQALGVMERWGFAYRSNLVWVKPSIGLGSWLRHRHELLLVGTKGGFPAPEPTQRVDSVIEARRRRHSQKPDCVYQLLEAMYPWASKLELFARTARSGWAAWGNEAPR
jgi:N6-adenosine-specific RNA methylase IME4